MKLKLGSDMIRIFNRLNGHEILIDETVDGIRLIPQNYNEDNPHMSIELTGFDWARHARTCSDCGAFLADFGNHGHSWLLEWQGKSWPLILTGFGRETGKNRLAYEISEYFTGTRLRLKLDTRTIDDLHEELNRLSRAEEYEGCVLIRDLIKAREGRHS
jgi:hypothetical protein